MSVLADRRFRRFYLAESLSAFGDSAMYLAMAIWVKELTGSNAQAGAVIFAVTAGAVTGPVTGYFADRVARLRLTIAVDVVTGGAVLALFAVRGRRDVWVIYTVAAVYGVSLSFLNSARSGLLRDLLPDDQLGPANAVLQTTTQGVQLAAPLVGAGLFAAVGGAPVAAIDTATFVIAAGLLATIRLTESHRRASRHKVRRDVTAGVGYIRHNPILRQLTVTAFVMCAVIGVFEPVTFAVVDQGLHRGASYVGVLVAVSGAGAVAGGLLSPLLLRRVGEPRMLGLALVLFAIGAAGLITHSLGIVLATTVAVGVALAWANVALATARQRNTPPHLQGRVAAIANLIQVAQTLSIGISATLIGIVDYRVVLAAAAVVLGCSALPVLIRPAEAQFVAPVSTDPGDTESYSSPIC